MKSSCVQLNIPNDGKLQIYIMRFVTVSYRGDVKLVNL